MGSIISFLTTKTFIGIVVVTVLISGIIGGVYLSQRQTQTKSKADEGDGGGDVSTTCNITGTYKSTSTGECKTFTNVCSIPPGYSLDPACSSSGGNTNPPPPPADNSPATSSPPACKTTSICGQKAAGNSPSDCVPGCDGKNAIYTCTQSDNSACNGVIACAPDNARCAGTGGPTTACPANTTDYPNCRACNSDGSAWYPDYGPKNVSAGSTWCSCTVKNSGADYAKTQGCNVSGSDTFTCSSTDYGPASNKTQWCGCVVADGASSAERKQGLLKRGPNEDGSSGSCDSTATSGNSDDLSKCTETPKFLDPKTLQPVPYVIAGKSYILQVSIINLGKTTTWDIANYSLVPSDKTKQIWGVSGVSLKDSLGGTGIGPGQSALFNLPITAPVSINGNAQNVGLYFQMANKGIGFSAACEPRSITVTPPNAATACFVLSENQTDVTSVTSCEDATAKAKGIIRPYTTDPTSLQYKFVSTTPGLKTIFVRFIPTVGTPQDTQKSINFLPAPILDTIACTQSTTSTGTVVAIRGSNFGAHSQQGAGFVKINNSIAKIGIWDNTNPAQNLIQASISERLDGDLNIELGIDDGRKVSGKCTVGSGNVQFTVNTQCTAPGAFSAKGLDFIIVEATAGAKPIISQKFDVNKGLAQNLVSKIQSGKKYSLILKAPRTVSKKVDFVADQGTKNLGEIVLTIGDIAPRTGPDGKINSLDVSEMVRQWSLTTAAAEKIADLSGDGAVNSLDYSCLKLGFNATDDVTISSFSR